MNKLHVLAVATLALLAGPVASFAGGGVVGAGAWTSVCSAGATIDEISLRSYEVDGSSLFHKNPMGPQALVDVIARYNVTNTEIPETAFPAWTTMELGFTDPGPMGAVIATLFAVNACTGERHPICGPVSSFDSNIADCVRCPIFEAINFTLNLYYVEVIITRDDPAVEFKANTLRISSTP